MWTDPGTGRVLVASPAPGRGLPREAYRSRVDVPPSRVETARAERLARLKAMHAEVHAPDRRQLRAMAAEVRAPDVLKALQLARVRFDRVGRDVRAWRRGAGRRVSLPVSLSRANDAAFDEFTQAWVAAQRLLATVGAAVPKPSRAQLRTLRDEVHAAVPGRRLAAAARRGATAVASNHAVAAVAPRWPAWQQEYRRLSNLIYEQDGLVASALPGSAGQRAALAEGSRLRAQAVRLRGG